MLYAILKPVVKAALRLYFRRIVVSGAGHIDNGKPTLILANHTASFMDAIITACFVKRRIHFFTRGDVFRNGWVDKILRSLGMLPVYRMIDGREKLQLNDSSNEEAMKILAEGGAVLIFCEGASDISKFLKPLKKGPFRLAANAAAQLSEPPLLVPMGINYVTPTKPFGDAFLNISMPVSAAAYAATGGQEIARSATLSMRRIHMALLPLVWHIGEPGKRALCENMLPVLNEIRPRYSFQDSQALVHALSSSEPQVLEGLRADMADYHLWQRQHPVQPSQYLPAPEAWEWLLLLVGFPFALVGVVCNYAPLMFAKGIVESRVKEPDFKAAVFLSCAILALLVWYCVWLVIAMYSGTFVRIVFNPLTMALCGVFFLKIYRPALMKLTGLYHRLHYRRQNPSYRMVGRLHKEVREFVVEALKG